MFYFGLLHRSLPSASQTGVETAHLQLSEMELFYVLLVVLLVVFTASFTLAIIRTLQVDFPNVHIPPGVDQPGKLRVIHAHMVLTSAVVSCFAMISDRSELYVLFSVRLYV